MNSFAVNPRWGHAPMPRMAIPPVEIRQPCANKNHWGMTQAQRPSALFSVLTPMPRLIDPFGCSLQIAESVTLVLQRFLGFCDGIVSVLVPALSFRSIQRRNIWMKCPRHGHFECDRSFKKMHAGRQRLRTRRSSIELKKTFSQLKGGNVGKVHCSGKPADDFGIQALRRVPCSRFQTCMQALRDAEGYARVSIFIFHQGNLHQNSVTPIDTITVSLSQYSPDTISMSHKPMPPVRMQLRLPPDLHSQLQEAAMADDRSLNGEIVNRLRSTFKGKRTQQPATPKGNS